MEKKLPIDNASELDLLIDLLDQPKALQMRIDELRNSSSTLTSASTSNTNTPRTVFYDRIIFGGRWSSGLIQSNSGNFGVGFNGTHIFHCFFDINVNFTSFESLFKNTIGKGIAIP